MKISLIVPVFNEEDTIPIFYKTVRGYEELKKYDVEIVFINDGSKDATESIINALALSDSLVVPVSFTRNFGKEAAMYAGLENASGDYVVIMDADLQHPPRLIKDMYYGITKEEFIEAIKYVDKELEENK